MTAGLRLLGVARDCSYPPDLSPLRPNRIKAIAAPSQKFQRHSRCLKQSTAVCHDKKRLLTVRCYDFTLGSLRKASQAVLLYCDCDRRFGSTHGTGMGNGCGGLTLGPCG